MILKKFSPLPAVNLNLQVKTRDIELIVCNIFAYKCLLYNKLSSLEDR